MVKNEKQFKLRKTNRNIVTTEGEHRMILCAMFGVAKTLKAIINDSKTVFDLYHKFNE